MTTQDWHDTSKAIEAILRDTEGLTEADLAYILLRLAQKYIGYVRHD